MLEFLEPIFLVAIPVLLALVFFFFTAHCFKENERAWGIFGTVATVIFLVAAVVVAYYFFAPAELPFRPIKPHIGPKY